MPKKNEYSEADVLSSLSTRKCDSYGNWEIYYPSGGAIPMECRGKFTSPATAKAHLESFLALRGIENEAKKLKEEIKSIHELDHTYDDVELPEE